MTARLPLLAVALFLLVASVLLAETEPPNRHIVPAGSESAGKTLFVEKGCYQCHVAGEIKTPAADLDENLTIDLGGTDRAGWSRDQFARAIMNPNHTVSEEYRKIMMSLGANFEAENSPMPGFNELLTLSDLIHLTTFLENLSD